MSESMDTKYTFGFSWEISNFSMCPQGKCEYIESPKFTAENLDNSEWSMILYPRGYYDDYFMCRLFRSYSDAAVEEIFIDYKIEMVNALGETLAFERQNHCFFKKSGSNPIIAYGKLISNYDSLIVRCHMLSEAFRSGHFTECAAWTKICSDHTSFKWTIQNINSFPYSKSRKFFYTNTFQFEMDIVYHSEENSYGINICKLDKKDQESRVLIWKIVMVNADGDEIISKRDIHRFIDHDFDEDDDTCVFSDRMYKNALVIKGEFVKGNTVRLLCDFWVPQYRTLSEIKYNQEDVVIGKVSLKTDLMYALQDDFRRMLTYNIQNDVMLRIENDIFPAHKCVLSARSRFFRDIFDKNPLEELDVVDISDLNATTLHSLLVFLYTGQVDDLDIDSISNLLLAAHKYQVASLKEKCISLLMSSLTDENVHGILAIASMVGHEQLKASALDYIKAQDFVVSSTAESIEVEDLERI